MEHPQRNDPMQKSPQLISENTENSIFISRGKFLRQIVADVGTVDRQVLLILYPDNKMKREYHLFSITQLYLTSVIEYNTTL